MDKEDITNYSAPSSPMLDYTLVGSGQTETRIAYFLVGDEKRLCLPQVLNTVLRGFTLSRINAERHRLNIACCLSNKKQISALRQAGIIPIRRKSCDLITEFDAERLCTSLLSNSNETVKRQIDVRENDIGSDDDGKDTVAKKVELVDDRNTLQEGDQASNNDSVRVVGSLTIFVKENLSKQYETPVYKGRFEDLLVAVKHIRLGNSKLSEVASYKKTLREVELLRRTHEYNHPSIIRFFKSENEGDSLYVATELCQGTLKDYVDDISEWKGRLSRKGVLQQMSHGINFLHDVAKIVHRDLKPSNVLIHTTEIGTKIVISDFGMSKLLDDGHCSITNDAGTLGWMAPEVWNETGEEGNKKTTYWKESDIFSLGLLFYYVITDGRFPFGKTLRSQQVNISQDKIADFSDIHQDLAYLTPLIAAMLSFKSQHRPTAEYIVQNPALFDDRKIIRFIQKANSHVKTYKPCQQKALQNSSVIPEPDGNWLNVLPYVTKTYLEHFTLGKHGTPYFQGHEKDLCFLLRAIRNCWEHFNDLPLQVQAEIGASEADHVRFWLSRFPNVLQHLFEKLKSDKKFEENWMFNKEL